MSKVMLIASREFVENLRTKTFWLGILSVPIMLVIVATVPKLLDEAKDVRKYAVIDHSGWLLEAVEVRAAEEGPYPFLLGLQEILEQNPGIFKVLSGKLRGVAEKLKNASTEDLKKDPEFAKRAEKLADNAEFYELLRALDPKMAARLGAGIRKEEYERVAVPSDSGDPEKALREMLDEERLFAYFVIGPDPVGESDGNKYVSNNLTDTGLKDWLSRLASAEVRKRRIEREGIDPDVARRIQLPVVFDKKQVSATGEETEVEKKDAVRQYAPVAFVYMLWIAIMTIAQLLLTNTIEEKSNRIVEVLLSSVSALELMAGKILGIAATGLTTVGSWVICILVFLKYLPRFIKLDFDPSILVSDPIFLTSFVAYFLLGFLLYASILVGIGSACNSIKEAQNLMAPIMIMLMLPLLAMFPISQDPNGTLAQVLSFIPPFTPFVMMNRAAGPPALWEYVATTLLLLASIAVAFWAASRIFRVGILMTGKPPRISEIWRWVFETTR